MKIAVVSKQSGLSADTLRYYEKIGLIPPIMRNSSGIRTYNEHDLQRIEFVKCLRNAGVPIDALLEFFHLYETGDETFVGRRNILVEQRERLQEKIIELQSTLTLLNHKIDYFDNQMAQSPAITVEN